MGQQECRQKLARGHCKLSSEAEAMPSGPIHGIFAEHGRPAWLLHTLLASHSVLGEGALPRACQRAGVLRARLSISCVWGGGVQTAL